MSKRWRPGAAVLAAAVLGVGLALGAATMVWSMENPGLVEVPRLPDSDPDQEPVVFDHWSHQQYAACYSCHPSIFPMERVGFTHEDMDAGKFCGQCHDGKVAFSYDDDDVDCEVCHVE